MKDSGARDETKKREESNRANQGEKNCSGSSKKKKMGRKKYAGGCTTQ